METIWLTRPLTATPWPLIGLPAVSSARTLNLARPRMLAHEAARTPSTTALGQRSIRAATVWVSPFGSAKLTSASIRLGRSSFGRSLRMKLAAPLRSVVRGSLSATSLPSRAAPSPSSFSPASCSACFGSRGGSNENSS